MAIQVQGASGTMLEVDGTTFRAMRASFRPVNYGLLGMYRRCDSTANMGAIGGLQELYQWRWTDATAFGILYFLSVGVGYQAAPTSAVLVGLNGVFSRSYTASGTGGIRSSMLTDNGKLRSSMATSRLTQFAISNTNEMIEGTQTLDATRFGAVVFSTGTGALGVDRVSTTMLAQSDGVLFDSSNEGYHPAVLAANEGFVIRTSDNTFPAGVVWSLSVNCGWAEAAAF